MQARVGKLQRSLAQVGIVWLDPAQDRRALGWSSSPEAGFQSSLMVSPGFTFPPLTSIVTVEGEEHGKPSPVSKSFPTML